MDNLENKLKQCGKPTSKEGKELVAKMNECHYPLTSWGLEKVGISESDIILDIGCGGGRTIATLAEKATGGKIFGIDHSPDCVKWSKEFNQTLVEAGRVEVILAGVEKLPFQDNYFNLVTAVETIYFWPEILESLKEICRVLKPDGSLLIINEMYLSEAFHERNEECMATERMTIYSPEQVEELLDKAGFKNISIDLLENNNWLRCLASSL